jgi:hypothetical protein
MSDLLWLALANKFWNIFRPGQSVLSMVRALANRISKPANQRELNRNQTLEANDRHPRLLSVSSRHALFPLELRRYCFNVASNSANIVCQ